MSADLAASVRTPLEVALSHVLVIQRVALADQIGPGSPPEALVIDDAGRFDDGAVDRLPVELASDHLAAELLVGIG